MKYFIFLLLFSFSYSSAQGLPEEILQELNITESSVEVNIPVYSTNIKIEDKSQENEQVSVSGTFELVNKSNLPTQPFHYVVYGGLSGEGYLLQYPLFEGNRSEEIILDANETRLIDFDISFSDMTRYGDMGIEVRLEKVYGSTVHKSTKKLELSKNKGILTPIYDDISGVFNINNNEYGLVNGPTVYKEEDTLKLKITFPVSPFSTIISPKVSIYEQTYFSDPVREIDGERVVLSTEDNVTIEFNLPKNLDPAVYPIKIEFNEPKDRIYIPDLYGRYIMGGTIAGVIDLNTKYSESLITGFSVDISGLPPDIVNPDRRLVQDLDVKALIFNNKSNIVDEQTRSIRLGGFSTVDFELSEPVDRLKTQKIYIELLSDGDVINTYEQYIDNPPKRYTKEIYTALGILFGIIILMLIFRFMSRQKDRNLFAGVFIFFLLFVSVDRVDASFDGGVTHYYADVSNPDQLGNRDMDSWNWSEGEFLYNTGLNMNIYGGATEGCHAPGKIIPFTVEMEYALCGNVPTYDEDGDDNYSGAIKAYVFIVEGWFDNSQLDDVHEDSGWATYTDSYSLEKMSQYIDTAASHNGDENHAVYGPTIESTSNSGRESGQIAESYVEDFINKLSEGGRLVRFDTVSSSPTSGGASLDLSIVTPSKPGNYRVYFAIVTNHKNGESSNISYVDISVCGDHDACLFMEGDQYVDSSGVLRDEDGSTLDGYTVQSIPGYSKSLVMVDAYESDDDSYDLEQHDFGFLTACNYCAAIPKDNTSEEYDDYFSSKWSSTFSSYDFFDNDYWKHGDNSWIDVFGNMGTDNPIYSAVEDYFHMAEKIKESDSMFTVFDEDGKDDEYVSVVAHKDGDSFKFFDPADIAERSHQYGYYAQNNYKYNFSEYSLEELITNYGLPGRYRFYGLDDDNLDDTYIFDEVSNNYDISTSYFDAKTSCTIYEDFCLNRPGIQFKKKVGYETGLYQRETDGSHTFLISSPNSLATEEDLCAVEENSCPNIYDHTYDSDTKEVFDINGALTSLSYTPDGNCREICTNLDTHAYQGYYVYNELGERTDHYVFDNGSCLLYCPNTYGYVYDETNNDVYRRYNQTLDDGLEYDLESNSCIAGDACSDIDGHQEPIQYSYPAKAEDVDGIYLLNDDGTCSVQICEAPNVLDTYGSCNPPECDYDQMCDGDYCYDGKPAGSEYCSDAYWYCTQDAEWEVSDSLCYQDDVCVNDEFPGTQNEVPVNCSADDANICTANEGYITDGLGNCVSENKCLLLPPHISSGVLGVFDQNGNFNMADPTGHNDPVSLFNNGIEGEENSTYIKDAITDAGLLFDISSMTITGNIGAVNAHISSNSDGSCNVDVCPDTLSACQILDGGQNISTSCYDTSSNPENNSVKLDTKPNFSSGEVCSIAWCAQGSAGQYCNVLIDGEIVASGMSGFLKQPMSDMSSKEVEVVCSDGENNSINVVSTKATCRISPDFTNF